MKIAYLMGGVDRGGTETLLLDTLKYSEKEGLLCMMVYRKHGVLLPFFQQLGIPIYHLQVKSLLDFRYFFRLRALFQTNDVKIVHAQLPFDAFLAYWACLGTDIKIILTFHGFDFGYNMLARQMIKFIITRTALNLYVSQSLRTHYILRYSLGSIQEKQQVVYNGLDFSKFDRQTDNTIRQEFAIPEDILLLGCVGNFVPGRDQMTICRMLTELHKKQINFHFIFVGARSTMMPSVFDECVSFCRDNGLLEQVHFIGSRNDVPSILATLDAFVYASEHDTFGIAVIEAMAAGLPVIVNNWEVMMEITDSGRRAILYESKNISDFMSRVLYFIDNQKACKKQALDNSNWVRHTYTIQQHINSLKNHYRTILIAND